MLFKKKPKSHDYDTTERVYIQSDSFRGFKRTKLTAYGYNPALDGIKALTGKDLKGAEITTIFVEKPKAPYLLIMVGNHHVGTLFDNFSGLDLFRNGSVKAVHLDIKDGNAYLFYKAE